jgi:hypothetical protein
MDDVALANYIAGIHVGHVEAGRLEHGCAQLLGVKVGVEIWFSDYTLTKLCLSHGDINFSHYWHMPSILLHGFVARGRHPNLLELWWINQTGPESMAFFVVLKAARNGEVFVGTFHRLHLREASRMHRKAKREGRLIREQSGLSE